MVQAAFCRRFLAIGFAVALPAFAQARPEGKGRTPEPTAKDTRTIDAGTPDAGTPTVTAPAAGSVADGGSVVTDPEVLRATFEARLNDAHRQIADLREEMKTLLTAQPVQRGGWQEDWALRRRKLELVTFNGYLRVRPELFYNLNLWGLDASGQPYTDPSGYTLVPTSPVSNREKTNAGVNMRFRFEPTINVSEEVRIHAQFDILDNVLWGTTPTYGYSLGGSTGYRYDTIQFPVFSNSQTSPRSGINSVADAIAVKRLWGEVATPVGVLRFGRMPAQWGLGILYNDGRDIDADHGDNVDRVSFTTEPIHGFFITPAFEINLEGPSSLITNYSNQPFDLSPTDDVHTYLISVARLDTPEERAKRLAAGKILVNYGLHFAYRNQSNDSIGALNGTGYQGLSPTAASTAWVPRRASLFYPDLWAKVEGKRWRVEAEVAAILGSIGGRSVRLANLFDVSNEQSLYIYQVGGVLQGEYRFLNGDLEVGGELGVASGDKSPGMGVYNRRVSKSANGAALPGDIDGPQYSCGNVGACANNEITNFTFNPAYRADMILYREILGGITDSIYIKPRIKYRIATGFEAWFSFMYSRAMFVESTPSFVYGNTDGSLGIELNAGGRFQTRDGFFAQVQYGVLFPLGGLSRQVGAAGSNTSWVSLNIAHAVRGMIGIKF